MTKQHFQAQQIKTFLKKVSSKRLTGTLKIALPANDGLTQKNYILVLNNGGIAYGGSYIPERDNFVKIIAQKINPKISSVAIQAALEKSINAASVTETLSNLVHLQVLTWEQIDTFLREQVLLILEYISPYFGELQFNLSTEHDLFFGKDSHCIDLSTLEQELDERQQKWEALRPFIPSPVGIPYLVTTASDQIKDPAVLQHLKKWVDGKRSLLEIAQELDKKPLNLACSYFNWVKKGWITFENTTILEDKNRPTILSVDDSPIVQATIKRFLGDRYNLLLASNAVDALNLLNQNEVSLLLLDLTMPDMDGLEVCKTLRTMAKFKLLPIVMVTARDGLVNKMKGQIAGTNRYLTKPFNAEELLSIVNELVSFGNA